MADHHHRPHRDAAGESAMMPPTDTPMERLALAAAKEASRQTFSDIFSLLGVNVADLNSMQKLRDDLAFAHSMRIGAKTAGVRVAMTVLTTLAAAAAIALWEVAKDLLHYFHLIR